MLVSFAHTTPAFLARQKTVIRASWEMTQIKKFYKGQVRNAYGPEFSSGEIKFRKIGTFEVIEIELQSTLQMPDSDYEAGGYKFLKIPWEKFEAWRKKNQPLCVLRFKILEVFPTEFDLFHVFLLKNYSITLIEIELENYKEWREMCKQPDYDELMEKKLIVAKKIQNAIDLGDTRYVEKMEFHLRAINEVLRGKRKELVTPEVRVSQESLALNFSSSRIREAGIEA